MNRNIARNAGFTAAGMLTAGAALVAATAYGNQAARPTGPHPDQPIVSTQHDPQPTQTIVQRVTQPRATTTVTQKPAAPRTTVRTVGPFGTNPGDCPQEDSCWADYDGKSNRWIIKKGEQPNRRQSTPDLVDPALRERANNGEFDPKPKPTTTTKAKPKAKATATKPATKPQSVRQAEEPQDDPNGPQPGEELRLPVAPQTEEPPAPNVR